MGFSVGACLPPSVRHGRGTFEVSADPRFSVVSRRECRDVRKAPFMKNKLVVPPPVLSLSPLFFFRISYLRTASP